MVSLVYRLYIVYALERTTNAEPFKNWLWKCLVIKRSPVLGVRYSNLQLSWVLRLWHFLTFYSQFRTQDPCQLLLAIWNKIKKHIFNIRIYSGDLNSEQVLHSNCPSVSNRRFICVFDEYSLKRKMYIRLFLKCLICWLI